MGVLSSFLLCFTHFRTLATTVVHKCAPYLSWHWSHFCSRKKQANNKAYTDIAPWQGEIKCPCLCAGNKCRGIRVNKQPLEPQRGYFPLKHHWPHTTHAGNENVKKLPKSITSFFLCVCYLHHVTTSQRHLASFRHIPKYLALIFLRVLQKRSSQCVNPPAGTSQSMRGTDNSWMPSSCVSLFFFFFYSRHRLLI